MREITSKPPLSTLDWHVPISCGDGRSSTARTGKSPSQEETQYYLFANTLFILDSPPLIPSKTDAVFCCFVSGNWQRRSCGVGHPIIHVGPPVTPSWRGRWFLDSERDSIRYRWCFRDRQWGEVLVPCRWERGMGMGNWECGHVLSIYNYRCPWLSLPWMMCWLL